MRSASVARLHAGVLGKHHGGIGGKIAMSGVARRLDDDPRQRSGVSREHARRRKGFHGGADVPGKGGKDVHVRFRHRQRRKRATAGAA